MLKFTLKYLVFAPTCFGPFGPYSGISLRVVHLDQNM